MRVLGVDDWAWRKQQNYGTLLMDLEQSKVIDLLPDRSAESFARWLQGHPEVAIITRDRSGLYADGARKSAPFAAQITDRYHLVSNLAEAVERDVQQLQTQARAALAEHRNASDRGTTGKKLTLVQARYQRSRQARYEKYMAVVELRRQGLTQVQIGGRVGLDPETVARWLAARSFPERRVRSDRRQDRALFLEAQQRGVHLSGVRTHDSSGRVPRCSSNHRGNSQRRKQDILGRSCGFVRRHISCAGWRSGSG